MKQVRVTGIEFYDTRCTSPVVVEELGRGVPWGAIMAYGKCSQQAEIGGYPHYLDPLWWDHGGHFNDLVACNQ